MPIYVKLSSAPTVTAPWKKEHFLAHGQPIIGLCITDTSSAAHYLFAVVADVLRRYPLREIQRSKTVLPMYQEYDDTHDSFKATPQPATTRYAIPRNSVYFSPDEIKTLQENIQLGFVPAAEAESFVYFAESPLSETQQRLLFFGVVTSTPAGISFYQYIKDNLMPLPGFIKICRAIVENQTAGLDTDERGELLCLKFEYFSPNRINNFSHALYGGEGRYHPTIGDIQDFYRHCVIRFLMQHNEVVSLAAVFLSSDAVRAIRLGTSYDFQEAGTYNPQGLLLTQDRLFRCIIRIIELQNESNNKHALTQLLTIPDFFEVRLQLIDVIDDIIDSVRFKIRTALTQYIDLYSSLHAVYSEDHWGQFLTRLQMAKSVLFELTSPQEMILKDTSITDEQRESLLLLMIEKKYKSVQVGALLLLMKAGLLGHATEALLNESHIEIGVRIALFQQKIIATLSEQVDPALIKNFAKNKNLFFDIITILRPGDYNSIRRSALSDYFYHIIFLLQAANAISNLSHLIDSLHAKVANIITIHDALAMLNKENRLTIEYANTILLSNPNFSKSIAEGLIALHRANQITPDHIATLNTITNTKELYFGMGLLHLQNAKILTPERFNILKNHENLKSFLSILEKCNRIKMVTPECFDLVNTHPETSILSEVFFRTQCFTPDENFYLKILRYPDIALLRDAIKELGKACNKKNILLVLKHDKPIVCAKVLLVIESYHVICKNTQDFRPRPSLFLIGKEPVEPRKSEAIIAILHCFTNNKPITVALPKPKKLGPIMTKALKDMDFFQEGEIHWASILGDACYARLHQEPTPRCCAMM